MAQDPVPVLVLVGFPLFLMAFFKPAFRLALVVHGFPRANGAEQVVPGQAVANGFYVVGMTSFAFFAEHGWNTWDRLRASSATSAEIVMGKALPHLLISFAQFVAIFAIGTPLLDLRARGSLLTLALPVLAFGLCVVMLGVMLTALCHTIQQVSALAFGGLVLLGSVGGALVPIDVVPAWARAVAPATPTYWVVRAFRSVILDGAALTGVLLPTGVLLAMAAGCTAVSLARLRFTDAKASLA